MELREFFDLVTPDGIRCIAMQTAKGFVQFPAHDLDSAVKMSGWIDRKDKNCFFALASFKETYHNENGKERVRRKRNNIDKLKALWLDIDFKDFESPVAAVEAIRAFLKHTGFPPYTVAVRSGNGLHLYWGLEEPLGFDEWHPYAVAFKKLCQEQGLPADHACTADGSRVLRTPHTRNLKDSAEPKPVVPAGGSGKLLPISAFDGIEGFDFQSGVERRTTEETLRGGIDQPLPAHLRAVNPEQSDTPSEFGEGVGKKQDIRNVVRHCGVLRSTLANGGADQSEPEWSLTLMLLAHLDGGAKLVHAMSKGHSDYCPDTTNEKWQQKVEAKEDGSGPPLCSSFEQYYPDICKKCEFYDSKKVKTPKSLAYLDFTPTPSNPNTPQAYQLGPVQKVSIGYPTGYRAAPTGTGVEKSVWNDDTGKYEYERVLRHTWMLIKATRNVREKDCYLVLRNTHHGNITEIPLMSELLGSGTKLTEALARYGVPIYNAKELKEFKTLMGSWLDDVRASNSVEDTTDQLGWIEVTKDEESEVIGFATAASAHYLSGEKRTGVVNANSKHRGIVQSFQPVGDLEAWKTCASYLTDQNCPHVIAMLASAFAGPLVRFTGLQGAVLSFCSEDSGAGKTTAMNVAQAVWGDPANAPATIQDTPTVIKNKIAFLQNVTVYWDEVRGDERVIQNAIDIAFQVSQGRDRERANSQAETIRAQTWQTMLVTASNDSLFDLAGSKLGSSDAGVYRFFELKISKEEFPRFDPALQSEVVNLHSNFGHAGQVYAEWLTKNYDRLASEMEAIRLKLVEKLDAKGPERFWLATVATLIQAAKYANESGLTDINVKELTSYLIKGFYLLRSRVNDTRMGVSPTELITAYMQQHQDGMLMVSDVKLGGGPPPKTVSLEGHPEKLRKMKFVYCKKHSVVQVNKTDFTTWLLKSRGMRWTDKLANQFTKELQMFERRLAMGAGTDWVIPRAYCLQMFVDTRLDDGDNETDV